ncbi:nol6 [Acrasis kona]|uniref:Nol6 n=1 Tax=Acrasis kona TaxID=1008807 RepID=A0AAW2Z7G7_9EUKA
MWSIVITIVLIVSASYAQLLVRTHWHDVVIKSRTIPTFQIVTNPLILPSSKIGKKVYQNIKELEADWSRFAGWFPYPRMSVAELYPPNCSSVDKKTSWDFKLLDEQIVSFLEATRGHPSHFSISTQPAWMFKVDKLVDIPQDFKSPVWNYLQGTQLVDDSIQQLADYYGRVAAWYSHGGFVDECGTLQKSNHFYNVPGFEIFNEIETEHQFKVEYYTKVYDKVVAKVKKYLPNAEFIGLSLTDPRKNFDYMSYFLNSSNHDANIPLDWISYHFYSLPDSKSTLAKQMFQQADDFLSYIPIFEKIRSSLSPTTKTTINELGTIFEKPEIGLSDDFWIMSGAQFAYCFAKLSAFGIEAVGMSQMVGFPGQYPSVSMVNWETGVGNSRYYVLKMIIKHVGLKMGAQDVVLVSTEQPCSSVFVQSYLVATKGGEWVKKTLFVNKGEEKQNIKVDGLGDGRFEYVDGSLGPFSDSKTVSVKDSVEVGPYCVGFLVYDVL